MSTATATAFDAYESARDICAQMDWAMRYYDAANALATAAHDVADECPGGFMDAAEAAHDAAESSYQYAMELADDSAMECLTTAAHAFALLDALCPRPDWECDEITGIMQSAARTIARLNAARD